MTTVAADIGGTHARFAFIEDGDLRAPEKHAAERHETLVDALQAYCVAHDAPPAGRLLIATAARAQSDGSYLFTNRNRWRIDREELRRAGWHVDVLINDFAASARGALALPPEHLITLREGEPVADAPRAILGPGTGLGLALAIPNGDGWRVQETFGGHMAAASVTAEQAEIMRLVRDLQDGRTVVYEDLASGRALPTLYHAAALFNGRAPRHHDDLLADTNNLDIAQSIRLFHEFLGLFAQTVTVAAHTFGGLYLDGGLIHRLHDDGLFNLGAFECGLTPSLAPVVHDALCRLPVTLVRDPFVALRGLLALADAA